MPLYNIDRFIVEVNAEQIEVRVTYDSDLQQANATGYNITTGQPVETPSPISHFYNDRVYTYDDVVFQLCVGNNQHELRAIFDFPFVELFVNLDSPSCVNSNPSCDLVFSSVQLQSETSEGANNGKITVVATSSNNPIQYRINGGAWQASNIFSGLAPGSYKVDGSDNLGCIQSQTVVINAFKQTIIRTPAQNLSVNNESRWSAVFNPIVFEYQRKDYRAPFIVANNASQLSILIDRALLPEEQAGVLKTNCYVKSAKYEFSLTPVSVTVNAGTNQSTLVFSAPNIGVPGDDQNGFVNALGLRIGHRFVTEITFGPEIIKKVVTARHSANPKGFARADVSKYLRPVLKAVDAFQYDMTNYRDLNLSASYTARFREEWDGGVGEWNDIGNPFYVTFSALQLGNEFGSNMAAYVPFRTEPNETKKAKFLTSFVNPIHIDGLPFDLSFIYSEKIAGYSVYFVRKQLDINGVEIDGLTQTTQLLNEDGSVLLNEDGSKLLIERGDQALLQRVGINRLRFTGDYFARTKYLDFYLQILDGAQTYQITETKRIEVAPKPCSDYTYLKWLNPLGGWDYFCFDFKKEYQIDITDTQTIERFIEDYATQDSIIDVISKSAARKVIVGRSEVPAAQMDALSNILFSPKVYVLTSENPRKWQTVIIDTKNSRLYDTKNKVGDIELTFRMPEINTQKQ